MAHSAERGLVWIRHCLHAALCGHKLPPPNCRKSLVPEVHKDAPEVFVILFHAVVQLDHAITDH